MPKYDIALLTLNEPIDFISYPNIRPICLPDPRSKLDTKDGYGAIVAGWGTVGFSQPQSYSLKAAKLKVQNNEFCEKKFPRYLGSLLDTHMCAYAEGKVDFWFFGKFEENFNKAL